MTSTATLYTDEDMSALVATLLKARGLDITTVPEQGAIGRTDSEQLEFASGVGRCILTHNRVLGELHLQYSASHLHKVQTLTPNPSPRTGEGL